MDSCNRHLCLCRQTLSKFDILAGREYPAELAFQEQLGDIACLALIQGQLGYPIICWSEVRFFAGT